MIGDYDDDTHFCLKCHTTIIGLDNYVSHRKAGCAKNVVDLPRSPLPSQFLPPDESFSLKADDFFSSLELQSSSKKVLSTSGKNLSSGILTRSKTTAAIQASTKEIPQSKSGKNVWIGGHQLKLGYGDNQSKLINAVDNLERRKPLVEENEYEDSDVDSDEYEYEVDESSDEDNQDAPPRNHTGGKWKPSSPVQWQRPQDWNVPPPSFTGGKWKPTNKPRDNEDYPPPSFTGSKWSQSKKESYDAPPSNHTKGKWKPDEPPLSPKPKPVAYTSKPSPNYTKGKWIPEEAPREAPKKQTKITDDFLLRKSSGMVQYWCRPCNRRLASKIVYERHLKSELHFKRTLHDKDFDENVIEHEKRIKKKQTFPSVMSVVKVNKRFRPVIFIKCKVCKAKVNKSFMGKHLISHYHCRRGDITTAESSSVVLEYIHQVILQSPYQCGMCHFYFNHYKDFLQHWSSETHLIKDASVKGYYWCSLCKHKTDDNSAMYEHLISAEHEEVVAVINRSVPIVIKKVIQIYCQQCLKQFSLNIALVKHCVKEQHLSDIEAVVNKAICKICDLGFRSNTALKRHQAAVHNERSYFCTVCDLTFDDRSEAKKHRNGAEHRRKLDERTGVKPKKCDYCEEVFGDIGVLKTHMLGKHTEFCSKCIKCGATFALKQELSVHLRTNSCTFYANTDRNTNSCDKCPYSSESMSELLFHQVSHTEPLVTYPTEAKQKPLHQYKCPLCLKLFAKASLLGHLRIHTKERPFVCSICGKGFARKNNLMFHVKNHATGRQHNEKKSENPLLCSTCGASFKKRSVLNQHMLTHSGKMCKCPRTGCIFAARSMGELKLHFATHSDVRNFPCEVCDYRGKTKQQLNRHISTHDDVKKFNCSRCSFSARTGAHLKRHSRLHMGSKPYSCPHCNYKCNNLENLRKHILSTKKHKGKSIYHCSFCATDDGHSNFQSNFAAEFNAHLVTAHPDQFTSRRDAVTFISGIYNSLEDPKMTSYLVDVESDEEIETNEPKVMVVYKSKNPDPVVAASASTSKDTTATIEGEHSDEVFPMFIVSKDDIIPETWNLVGSYDVEESGALVPFNSDSEVLFDHHFQ